MSRHPRSPDRSFETPQGELFAQTAALDSRGTAAYVRTASAKQLLTTRHRRLINGFLEQCVKRGAGEGAAAAITTLVVRGYWERLVADRLPASHRAAAKAAAVTEIRPFFGAGDPDPTSIADSIHGAAARISQDLARLDVLEAGYWIGMIYSGLLPKDVRATLGVYYTPPPLAEQLLDRVAEAGFDWGGLRSLDPACGGGAFLAPLARRVRRPVEGESPDQQLDRVASLVHGFEIDPFGAWLAQVLLEAEMLEVCLRAGRRLPVCVELVDTLELEPGGREFDLIIGNPPYARTSLSAEARRKYARSLYGHANLYGLFTDQALRLASQGGVVAFITPTSFLAGQYFKNLRALIAAEAPPVSLDFVKTRAGVFEDVLQETALVVFRRRATVKCRVGSLEVSSNAEETIHHEPVGRFKLPADGSSPWIIAREPASARFAARLGELPHRLADYGYRVKTGPLVWNRHKDQLRDGSGPDRYPIIWAEAVRPDGTFAFRAAKRNHAPFFEARAQDDWLLSRRGCVLLQRTTAKEQRRRLMAARIPDEFVAEHSAVVVENHLNMLVRTGTGPQLATHAVLVTLLNSAAVDRAFRCMSGSVAVSAFELEALPLPEPDVLAEIAVLLDQQAPAEEIERAIERSYLGAGSAQAAAVAGDSAAA